MKMKIDPEKYYRNPKNGTIRKGSMWFKVGLLYSEDLSGLEEVTVTPVKPEPEPKPEPRRGKPGEVWLNGVGETVLLARAGSILIQGNFAFGGIAQQADRWSEGDGHTFLAASLEEWARKKWGVDSKRDEIEETVAILKYENDQKRDHIAKLVKQGVELKRENEEHRAHVAKLMKREAELKREIDIFKRDYVRKSDVVEALRMTEGWSESALSGKREFYPIYKARKALEKLGITPAK